MEHVVTVVEAKRSFSDLMGRVAYAGDRLVVERHGKPMIAWISYDDLLRLRHLEQQGAERRAKQMRALAAAEQSRQRIANERDNAVLPDSADVLNALQEGRIDELTDLR
ncbi:MAG TPA: type II toxin-antitoxin system prevent-host-death family antitoxin [Anaerolineae bacterium]|nr:type II toxin-antitoxin system prevent-host-death family antitoxin [Anaerolineae bacterium]